MNAELHKSAGSARVPAARRFKVGVITNPGSQRNKKGLGEMRELLDAAPDVHHAVLEKITDIPELLRDFARREVGVVVVAGGDGTVQAVLTELCGQRPFDTLPLLAVVPRGMTNMIAADVGLKRRGLGGLARLLEAAAAGELEAACVTRRILRLENAQGQGPLYGMFFGGAGITRAIDACRTKVHANRIEADAAIVVTLAGLLGGWLFHRGRGSSIFRGDRVTVTLDDREAKTLDCLMVLATTLDRLILGSRPYWNGGTGHLRFTTIGFPPRGLLRYAWRLLYGKPQRELPEESYDSCTADRVALRMDGPFTLDGELYVSMPGKDVIITAADEARFVRL